MRGPLVTRCRKSYCPCCVIEDLVTSDGAYIACLKPRDIRGIPHRTISRPTVWLPSARRIMSTCLTPSLSFAFPASPSFAMHDTEPNHGPLSPTTYRASPRPRLHATIHPGAQSTSRAPRRPRLRPRSPHCRRGRCPGRVPRPGQRPPRKRMDVLDPASEPRCQRTFPSYATKT